MCCSVRRLHHCSMPRPRHTLHNTHSHNLRTALLAIIRSMTFRLPLHSVNCVRATRVGLYFISLHSRDRSTGPAPDRWLSTMTSAATPSVVFVTGNAHKLAEVKDILADVIPDLQSISIDSQSTTQSHTYTANILAAIVVSPALLSFAAVPGGSTRTARCGRSHYHSSESRTRTSTLAVSRARGRHLTLLQRAQLTPRTVHQMSATHATQLRRLPTGRLVTSRSQTLFFVCSLQGRPPPHSHSIHHTPTIPLSATFFAYASSRTDQYHIRYSCSCSTRFLEKLGHAGLISLLAAYPDKSAYAQCTFAYVNGPNDEPVLFDGRCPGRIVDARSGTAKLFGWDPIFEPQEGQDGDSKRTFAEMDKEVKNRISHRAKALALVKQYFAEHPHLVHSQQQQQQPHS